MTRSWPLDWRAYFEQGIKWVAPFGWTLGLAFESFTPWPSKFTSHIAYTYIVRVC